MDVIERVQIGKLRLQVNVETKQQEPNSHHAGSYAQCHATYEPEEREDARTGTVAFFG